MKADGQDRMTTMESQFERVGESFSPDLLLVSRLKTWNALERIRASVCIGESEEEANRRALSILSDLGVDRSWHRPVVRFGTNTTKGFRELSEPGVRLKSDDIFFVDIGPIWDGHEGDAGETFIVGRGPHPEAYRCARDSKAVFQLVKEKWLSDGLSGQALYAHAEKITAEIGWKLCGEIAGGHRLSDFPHALHSKEHLINFGQAPQTLRWVLEIQIRHPKLEYGAFYEDLLLEGEETR